jgi:hypothetical protein
MHRASRASHSELQNSTPQTKRVILNDALGLTFPSPRLWVHEFCPTSDLNICPSPFYPPWRYRAESSPLARNPHFDDGGPGTGG